MVWLAFDMSIALGGLALIALGRWLFDLALHRQTEQRRID